MNDTNSNPLLRFNALAACDGTGLVVRPASVLAQRERSPSLRIIAIGRPREIDAHPAASKASTQDLPASVLTPALVNAHTHLDLTHIGPQPHDPSAGFVKWVDMVRSRRNTDPAQIAASVRRGIELSQTGGVVAVGDIAGAPAGIPNLTPYRTLQASPLRGTSYLEFFGIGTTTDKPRQLIHSALSEAVNSNSQIRLGLQPHAPNTVDLSLYQWAAEVAQRNNLPLSTHLAETPEEHEFIAHARGPQRQFLERMGMWADSILDHIGRGEHPVRHLRELLASFPFLVAHVNDADDAAIETLARTQTSVAYCPRASAYFAAERHFGPHRYREMLSAGVNVALGTDSIINLPARAAIHGMSTLDEARFLFQRDGTNPATLLRMATINGAAALGIDSALFRLSSESHVAGLIAVDVAASGAASGIHPFASCLTAETQPVLL